MTATTTLPTASASTPPSPAPPVRVWLDGTLYEDASDARIGVTDHGLVVGDGVFESLKVTAAGPFALSRHLHRMSRSAAALGLPTLDEDFVRAGVAALLEGPQPELGLLRLTYTGGRGPLGSSAAFGPPTLVAALVPTAGYPPTTAVVTAPWRRNEHGALAGVKSTSYAENVRVLAHAAQHGASEGLLLNTAGQVCEGTGSNVFYVLDGRLVTPTLTSGPLAGITRELLLEWLDVDERDVSLEEAQTASEVFLSSSLRDVQAVHRWDDRDYPAPGPLTTEAARIFAARSAADVDP